MNVSESIMPEDMKALRARLNQIDSALLEHLAQRRDVVNEIAQYKALNDRPVRDTGRERELLKRVAAKGGEHDLEPSFVVRIFQEIIDHSVRRQQHFMESSEDTSIANDQHPQKVVYLGAPGSYSHQAAQRHFSARMVNVEYEGRPDFESLVRAVESRAAGFAVLPIENTTAGSINEVYDLMVKHRVFILGEEVEKVDHCLVAAEELSLDEIRTIYSHPQAFAQCRNFLTSLGNAKLEAVGDTASAAALVKEKGSSSAGAVTSTAAAREHGLVVLRQGITNHAQNFTRFVVVGAEEASFSEKIPCKTSIVFEAKDETGSLLKVMNCLADSELNLTKLESRPLPETPWSYRFFVDFEGNQQSLHVQHALQRIEEMVAGLVTLGTYPGRNIAEALPVDIGHDVDTKKRHIS